MCNVNKVLKRLEFTYDNDLDKINLLKQVKNTGIQKVLDAFFYYPDNTVIVEICKYSENMSYSQIVSVLKDIEFNIRN